MLHPLTAFIAEQMGEWAKRFPTSGSSSLGSRASAPPTFIGQRNVTTDADGVTTFTKAMTSVVLVAGAKITATATGPAGDTSEFSPPREVAAP